MTSTPERQRAYRARQRAKRLQPNEAQLTAVTRAAV
jgi:hypothetical protein